VLRLGTRLLAEEAKDLEVAAWCTEALLRIDGLAGFAAGCTLMQGLVEIFWDDLHPMPDEDGMADRVAPISGLNGESGEGTLIQPLRKVTLFSRPDGTPVALWQYQQSAEVAGIGDVDRREQRIAGGVVRFEQIEADARVAGTMGFARLRQDAGMAAAAWRNLADSIDIRAGSDAPSISRVRDLLDEMLDIAARFGPPEAAADQEFAAEADGASADVAGVRSAGGPRTIATREDALRIIDEVAAFFRRTEPHSPLAYTLYEAVRRGRLTWPELLAEIVPDQENRDTILRSLGIRPLPPSE
jgi:type VI secretion system protein ImpA